MPEPSELWQGRAARVRHLAEAIRQARARSDLDRYVAEAERREIREEIRTVIDEGGYAERPA